MPSTILYYNNYKRFLDETADKLGNLKRKEVEELYENLIETVLEQDSVEIIEEIFGFCSASVLEMIQSAKGSLLKIFEQRNSLKVYSNFHVLISSVVSTVVKASVTEFEERWIELLLESVISGLTAIESETISLSGSSLIKLLKWEEIKVEDDNLINVSNFDNLTHKFDISLCEKLSKKLADHPDFVVILVADMCAMFSRIEEEEVDSAPPFLRIVRFCELLINVSDEKSGLMNKIVETVKNEFINKVYRTTLNTISNKNLPLKWSNELLKICHRGNELVKPLVGEVFKIKNDFINSSMIKNYDFIEILSNERSRKIPEIVQLLFSYEKTTEETEDSLLLTESESDVDDISKSNVVIIDDEYYKISLIKQLESFEMFKIENFKEFKSISLLGICLFKCNRLILLNWLPYILKFIKIIETKSVELKVQIDISKKLNEFLDL